MPHPDSRARGSRNLLHTTAARRAPSSRAVRRVPEDAAAAIRPWRACVPAAALTALASMALPDMLAAVVCLVALAAVAVLVREVVVEGIRRHERTLHLQAAALEAAGNMIVITDRRGLVQYVNRAYTKTTGFTSEDAVGLTLSALHPVFSEQPAVHELWLALDHGRAWHGELLCSRKDGSTYPQELYATPIFDPAGTVTNVVAVATDITERRRQSEQLAYLARHDVLTGLHNRQALAEHLSRAVASASRGRPSALLYLDLDQFKVVNDSLGHAAGDRLIQALSGILQANVRKEDVLARLGGDEFALLLSAASPEHAVAVAEKLRMIIGEFRFVEDKHIFDVDVSIGVATIDGTASDSDVLAHADMACYAAKAQGRNRVELYRPDRDEQQRLTADAAWAVRLKDALRENRFCLYFQPIVSVREGDIGHYEALVRLVEEDGTVVPPGAFIPAAERFGLVHELDRWVITAALARLEYEVERGNPMHIAINLSGLSFHEGSTLVHIRQQLARRKVDPRLITFEITETAAITNIALAQRFIGGLKELGCRFALDDFGNGFCSFSYLKHLSVDFVKIDGSFVKQLPNDRVNQVVVRSLNETAHSMGIRTIAEFVEDQAILDTLQEIGVDFAQGYHLGHPSPTLG